MKYLQKCIGLFFQSVHWIIFWPGKLSKPAKTLSCTKLQWSYKKVWWYIHVQESWKGDNKLKALVVCNLSGWKGISEKNIEDCPMCTQLCIHSYVITQKGFPWVIQVKGILTDFRLRALSKILKCEFFTSLYRSPLRNTFPQRNWAEIISGSNESNFPRNSRVRELI